MYKLTKFNTVIRLADNASIPMDPANSDYARYLEWLAVDGNTPEPAYEDTEEGKLAIATANVLSRRAAELAASDWIVVRAVDMGQPTPSEWAEYRQALRDITAQPGFPLDVTFPVKPTTL